MHLSALHLVSQYSLAESPRILYCADAAPGNYKLFAGYAAVKSKIEVGMRPVRGHSRMGRHIGCSHVVLWHDWCVQLTDTDEATALPLRERGECGKASCRMSW